MSSIALQLTPEQAQHARRLMALSTLETIRLIHVRAANMGIPGCPVKAVEEKPHPTTSANEVQGTNRFRVVIAHSLRAKRGGETPEVQIDASFELLYSVPPDTKPTAEELQAFADTNAVMNCWPYWRELVQNTVVRMNLPPLVVPLMRFVPPAAPKKEQEEAATTTEAPAQK